MPEEFKQENQAAEKPEIIEGRAPKRSKHKQKKEPFSLKEFFKMNKTTRDIVIGVVIFALLTTLLVVVRVKLDSSLFHGNTVVDEDGDGIDDKEEEAARNERLSVSMKPIAIDESSPFYDAFMSSDRVNVLLLGVNQGMTDTIMLGSYDMERQSVDIISVPRDTFYYRPAYGSSYGFQKINSVYRTDGVAATAEAVSSLLYGMPIHYYAIVEYDDIRKVMDAIGGVQINIPFHMKYQDTTKGQELYVDIPAGLQTIDSSNVIEFLRFRHTNPSYARQGYKSYQRADIDRIEVQQNFVKEFIKKCVSGGNLSSVVKIALENVESDLTYSMASKIAAKALSGLNTDSLNSYMLPGIDKTMHELSFWVANESETYTMLETIYHLNEPEESATDAAVSTDQNSKNN